jgi:hypothetical protein
VGKFVMLLDPLSALSLTSTVVRFVDFTSKILTKGLEIYSSTSGALPVNDELEIISNDLLKVTDRLRKTAHSETDIRKLSMDEQARGNCWKLFISRPGVTDTLGFTESVGDKAAMEEYLSNFQNSMGPRKNRCDYGEAIVISEGARSSFTDIDQVGYPVAS